MFPEMNEFTTGAPPLGDYIEIFRGLAQSVNSILCIFVSKALSAINEAAVQASVMFKSENTSLPLTLTGVMVVVNVCQPAQQQFSIYLRMRTVNRKQS